MGFTKLFSDILCSSVWNEDDKTRIVWITLLAMKGANNISRCSIDGLAHQARVSIDDCEKSLKKLSSPDRYSGDPEFDGRRIERVDHGWLILNGEKYRMRRDEEDRREYMATYMKQYRRRQAIVNNSVNNCKESKHDVNGSVNNSVNNVSIVSLSDQIRSEADKNKKKSSCFVLENEASRTSQNGHSEQKRKNSPMMSNADLEELEKNPAYEGVDIKKEAFKFVAWCDANSKPKSKKRFVNWLNRV